MDDPGDLSAYLRTRRALVDPAEAGIPVDSRRRVAGLRREEVAHLAGVSVDYYVRLEQGRARQPSEQVVAALARVLRLSDVEQQHLLRLARPKRGPARRPAPPPLRPELHRVLALMGDAPAMVIDHRMEVIAANALVEALYGRPARGLNTARHIFLDEDGRCLYADWEKCTRDVVGHLRLSAGKHPDDPRLAELIGELSMNSERFGRLWARADVRCREHGRKAFHHPLVGELDLHQENFELPDGTGRELVVLTAAENSPSATNLRLLATLAAVEEGTDRVEGEDRQRTR